MLRCSMLLSALIALFLISQETQADEQTPIDIGNRRELLVDYLLIDTLDDVRLVLNRPRDEGPVIRFDNPWEGLFCGYCTMIKDGERFLAYYRGRPEAGADGDPGEVYCLAESSDGIQWTKPEFDLFPMSGHAKTNIILANAAPGDPQLLPHARHTPWRACRTTLQSPGWHNDERADRLEFSRWDSLEENA
jgi:hypothetical protein